MKKISLITLSVILSLTLCISSVISSFAEEGFEIPEIEEVTEEELVEVIDEEEVDLLADASTAVYYIGEDEASRVYYDTFVDAVKATNNSSTKTIHLLKDATWEGYTYEGGYGAHHKHFILEGYGYTLTLNQQIHVSLNSEFTFNDVTVNLNSSYAILIGCNGKLTLGDKTTVTGRTADGYAFVIENRNGSGGTFTMLPGSKLTGNKANVLGAVYAGCAGTINIEGEITGNTSGVGAVRINSSGVTVNVGKNANITGNTSKNFVPLASTTFNVASDFEGTVGVSYGAAGDAIGNVAEGADVSGITLDGSTTVATNKNGVLTWETEEEAAAKNAVCYIDENVDGKRYASLDAAIKAAGSGSTIFVTKDITLDIAANTTYGY
ncbi:MAG: hypothetical protein Q4G23_06625, partial [Clostridia bacterium]|nr:hypothetical protein [Clostridia bacterium]